MKMIAPETKNTLCPYLVRKLTEGLLTNDEHVLPFALGAPQSFVVVAAMSENNRLNKLVDAPMINDPLIQTFSMLAGIRTRSGLKEATMHGQTHVGDKYVVNVTKDSVTPRFKEPVVKDEKTGKVIGVRGFGDSVFEAAKTLSERMAAKGQDIGTGPMLLVERKPDLEMSFVSNHWLLLREAIKTAYLVTVKAFGDKAIESASGRIFREAIEAETDAALTSSRLHLQMLSPDQYINSLNLKVNHHMLTAELQDNWLFSQVLLFGGLIYAFWTPRDDIQQENCFYGTIIDASKRQFIPASEVKRQD